MGACLYQAAANRVIPKHARPCAFAWRSQIIKFMRIVRSLQTFPIMLYVVAEACARSSNPVYEIPTPIMEETAKTTMDGIVQLSRFVMACNSPVARDRNPTKIAATEFCTNTLSVVVMSTVSTKYLIPAKLQREMKGVKVALVFSLQTSNEILSWTWGD